VSTNRPTAARRHGGLLVLLGAATAFRLLGYLAAGPLLAPSDDSLRYAHGGLVALFSDPFAPSGYPILLAALHFLWPGATAVSLIQHALGLVSVALLWLCGREVARVSDLPAWPAALPAVFVAFSGDQWFFEQSLMTETLFTALLLAAVLAVLRAARTGGRRGAAWAAAGGATIAAAAVTRPAGFVAAVLCAVWLLVLGGTSARRRLGVAGAFSAAATAVVVAYLLAAGSGQNGLGSYAGWTLYGRVAPFADCARFTPPAGTSGLCESRPPAARPGIYFYLFGTAAGPGQTSPAVAVFGSAPHGNAKLGDFAIRAIEAQPLDYLRTVAKDAFRYVDPTYGNHRPEAGIGPEFVYLSTSLAPYPARDEVQRLYGYKVSSGPLLYPYQSWLVLSRVPGLLWLAVVAAALAGVALARTGARRQLLLIAGVAFAAALTPVLTVTYEYRYSVPEQGLALLAGVLGAWNVSGWLRARRSHAG
jgi:hypothetical protein